MQITDEMVRAVANSFRWPIWHCTKCDHEWPGRDERSCGWCGAPAREIWWPEVQ